MKAHRHNWLAMCADTPQEVEQAMATLATEPGLAGLYLHGDDVGLLWQWFTRGFHLVQAAGGAIGDGHGRLLAIHRLGRWDLPKGKVERGETVEAAALREVREECGLQQVEMVAPLCETWHTYHRDGLAQLKCTHWFLMKADPAQRLLPQAEEDIDAVKWLDAAGRDAMRIGTYPSLQPVISAWEAAHRGD